jgi:hypothetical protein
MIDLSDAMRMDAARSPHLGNGPHEQGGRRCAIAPMYKTRRALRLQSAR